MPPLAPHWHQPLDGVTDSRPGRPHPQRWTTYWRPPPVDGQPDHWQVDMSNGRSSGVYPVRHRHRPLSWPEDLDPKSSLLYVMAIILSVMVIFNLGCGSRTSPYCVNIDWSPYLRLKRNRFAARLAPLVLRGERRERFHALDDRVVVHDLRRGVPAADDSLDGVYHSHLLEHLDRSVVREFLAEVRRTLRVGGVHRIVVPDFELTCRRYLAHLDECLSEPDQATEHDRYVADMIEQMVRRMATGTEQQPPLWRFLENLLLGDARRRGESHRWMYDRVNLYSLLSEAGFRDVQVVDFRTSAIPGWEKINLDQLDNGEEYIAGSLYVEAVK